MKFLKRLLVVLPLFILIMLYNMIGAIMWLFIGEEAKLKLPLEDLIDTIMGWVEK